MGQVHALISTLCTYDLLGQIAWFQNRHATSLRRTGACIIASGRLGEVAIQMVLAIGEYPVQHASTAWNKPEHMNQVFYPGYLRSRPFV